MGHREWPRGVPIRRRARSLWPMDRRDGVRRRQYPPGRGCGPRPAVRSERSGLHRARQGAAAGICGGVRLMTQMLPTGTAPTLETERLKLRAHRLEDLDDCAAM